MRSRATHRLLRTLLVHSRSRYRNIYVLFVHMHECGCVLNHTYVHTRTTSSHAQHAHTHTPIHARAGAQTGCSKIGISYNRTSRSFISHDASKWGLSLFYCFSFLLCHVLCNKHSHLTHVPGLLIKQYGQAHIYIQKKQGPWSMAHCNMALIRIYFRGLAA